MWNLFKDKNEINEKNKAILNTIKKHPKIILFFLDSTNRFGLGVEDALDFLRFLAIGWIKGQIYKISLAVKAEAF